MSEITRSALLPYPAADVFELINDVTAYPHYLDGCVGAEVLLKTDEIMEARLDLAKKGLKYSLTTRNRLVPPSLVAMELVDGPFKSFSGEWRITALSENACKVSLHLAFTLESRALSLAARALFNPMADNLVDAVVKRAHSQCGRAGQ